MNLYRSFGNLMEVWVAEEDPCPDLDWYGKPDSLTVFDDMGASQRSESVDSGVETASCDTFLSTSCPVSPDNVDITSFLPPQRERLLSQASTSPQQVLSSPFSSSPSSSSHVFPSRAAKTPSALQLKLEQTLQRTDTMQLKEKPKWFTGDGELSQRPQASCLPKRHASEIIRTNGNFVQKTTGNPTPTRMMSEICRRPQSMTYNKQRSEGPGITETEELSPGFSYLKQVCQMLEDFARQQMYNQSLQPEVDGLWGKKDEQVSNTCQSDSTASQEDISSRQRLENMENVEQISSQQQRKYEHIRQKSMSDTALSTLHLRKLDFEGVAQRISTNDLLERDEDERDDQDDQMPRKTTFKNWKLKLGSIGRVESSLIPTRSQRMQSPEKNSARRRLSQLFKRKKTPA
ncbi:uncharacterized protein LOC114473325 [Gouania willdenowi]|uniref:uncharacterized protein LOC114473325 n=1 Tax=Gouania willdenowi TaxID=441366 RepID=UPI0010545BEA|nr:uncharacterized protein LOC114473325 [Gouania willdenowi]